MTGERGKYDTAVRRWAGVGPYYAMFPAAFADKVVKRYSKKGDLILDPFAGRGTAVFSAAAAGRYGIGIEINPVGWVYTKVKLAPAEKQDVLCRLEDLQKNAYRYRIGAERVPEFFHMCYAPQVREFLLAARQELDWRRNNIDRTLMALLLVHLHGKRTDSFSNQMRQTKSMSPLYAMRWWKENGHVPPEVDPVEFMKKKIDWRYAKGRPTVAKSRVYLGNSVKRLRDVAECLPSLGPRSAALLLTSPPYCGITNYHYDQWMRLWLLGGPNAPRAPSDSNRGKFVDRKKYRQVLSRVFGGAAPLLSREAVIYVRTDSRELTLGMTVQTLQEVFPKRRLRKYRRPFSGKTQTALFGGESAKNGEVDIVLYP